jgi:hypothetical protein
MLYDSWKRDPRAGFMRCSMTHGREILEQDLCECSMTHGREMLEQDLCDAV